ncbi:MAG: glycosyltransferase family 4 protein, partial [Symploca sp. SIO3E6]|nr:glycosyltransferase family 4 protein [Caldora sp. SIO3E6]
VEAQACGTPVIAYGAGGALEIVRDIRQHSDNGTGLFFTTQTPESLIEAVKTFEASPKAFSPQRNRINAAAFAPKTFSDRYLNFLEYCYQDHQSRLFANKFQFLERSAL